MKDPNLSRRRRTQWTSKRLANALWTTPAMFALGQGAIGLLGAAAALSGGSGGTQKAALAVFLCVLMDMHDTRLPGLSRLQVTVARELCAISSVLGFGIVPALLLQRVLVTAAPLD